MLRRLSLGIVALALTASLVAPASAEWTRFRGPNGSGVSAVDALPSDLSPERAQWRSEVPFGRSSPVLGETSVFLTAADEEGVLVLALDRSTGEELWRRPLERRHRHRLHHATDPASPTPVTDGENVVVFSEEAGLASFDGSGERRWFLPLGPFRNFYGMSSSPILVDGRVILLCDQAEGSFLLAVDAASGRELWRTARGGRLESWATPIIVAGEGGQDEVLIFGSRFLDAYDPGTGRLLWSTEGVGAGPVAVPIVVGDLVVTAVQHHAESGWPPFAPLLEEHDGDGDDGLDATESEGTWLASNFGWLDTDGDGRITAPDWVRLEREVMIDDWGVQAVRLPSGERGAEKAWSYQKNVAYIASPVAVGTTYFMVENGILTRLDLATGELLGRQRIEGVRGKNYASPVVADGKIYLATLDGDVAVLDPETEGAVLATASFDEEIHATPAIGPDGIYLRTRAALYRFATEPKPGDAEPASPEKSDRTEAPADL